MSSSSAKASPSANGSAPMDAIVAIHRSLDQWLLATTIFLEARGEPPEGQRAVAHVVMNRVNDKRRRWGTTLREVLFQPYQFSCYNSLKFHFAFIKLYGEAKAFHDALGIASNVLAGNYEDTTGGANHYFSDSISPPSWADPKYMAVKIGRHRFYKL